MDNNKGVWKDGDLKFGRIVYYGKKFDHVPTEEEKAEARKEAKERGEEVYE